MRCCCRTTLLLLATPASLAWSSSTSSSSASSSSPVSSYDDSSPSTVPRRRRSRSAVSYCHDRFSAADLHVSTTALTSSSVNDRQQQGVRNRQLLLGRTRRLESTQTLRTGTVLVQSVASGGGDDTSSSSSSEKKTNARLPIGVLAVLSAAFLNLLGFTMAGPITPALGTHFGLEVGTKFGSLTSAYPAGMLLGLFVWPQFSDRQGRKPIMALSLLGSAIGLFLQAHAVAAHWSLPVFLACRVLTGCFAGSSPVSKAYLADLGSSTGKLPRYLALRDAASTLAFILGPTLGGLFFEANRRVGRAAAGKSAAASAAASMEASTSSSLAFVIGTSAIASLAASMLITLFVRDDPSFVSVSSQKKKKKSGDDSQLQATTDSNNYDYLVSCPLGTRLWTGVATVCVVSFLYNVADSTFFAFFPALLKNKLGLDARSIGLAFTTFACISFGVSTTTSGASIRRLGPVATCVMGLSAVGCGLLTLAGAATTTAAVASARLSTLVFGAAAVYYCGVPLYGPTIPTMLLRCVPPYRRGAVMGLDGAVNTLARVISPLVMGYLYRTHGPSAAFGVAGVAAFGAALTALLRRLSVVSGRRRGGIVGVGTNNKGPIAF